MKQKKRKDLLKKLARTAQQLAEQEMEMSRAQTRWLLEGCIVVLRDLGVSFQEMAQAWQMDEAEEAGRKPPRKHHQRDGSKEEREQ